MRHRSDHKYLVNGNLVRVHTDITSRTAGYSVLPKNDLGDAGLVLLEYITVVSLDGSDVLASPVCSVILDATGPRGAASIMPWKGRNSPYPTREAIETAIRVGKSALASDGTRECFACVRFYWPAIPSAAITISLNVRYPSPGYGYGLIIGSMEQAIEYVRSRPAADLVNLEASIPAHWTLTRHISH